MCAEVSPLYMYDYNIFACENLNNQSEFCVFEQDTVQLYLYILMEKFEFCACCLCVITCVFYILAVLGLINHYDIPVKMILIKCAT